MNCESRTPTGREEIKKEKRKGNYRYTKNREIAIEMRDKGMTFQQIADELGVTRQRVAQYCAGVNAKHYRFCGEKTCVYVGLREWMNENRVSTTVLLQMMGYVYSPGSTDRWRGKFAGENAFKIDEIKKILEVTGMTFEQAFGEVEGKND